MQKKIQKLPLYRLQDISVWSDKYLFFGPEKKPCSYTSQGYFVWKNVKNGGAPLDSFFRESWLYAWKFLDHLEFHNI